MNYNSDTNEGHCYNEDLPPNYLVAINIPNILNGLWRNAFMHVRKRKYMLLVSKMEMSATVEKNCLHLNILQHLHRNAMYHVLEIKKLIVVEQILFKNGNECYCG